MKKNPEPWDEIAGLIDCEKRAALEEFRSREFVPAMPPARRPVPMPVMRPWLPAVAASLIVATALASFWLLTRSWQSTLAAPSWNEIMAGSFLYNGNGRLEAGSAGTAATPPAARYFSAWAAALQRTPSGETVDPAAVVETTTLIERGDPGEVRQKIGRVIRENTLEHLLTQLKKIHDKEA